MPPLLTLTRAATQVTGALSDVEHAREEFARFHSVKLEGLIAGSVLTAVQEELDKGEFADRTHHGIGTELCLKPGPAFGMLMLMANDPALLRLVEQVTGCESIGCFEGRVYRFVPGSGHYDSWHSDVGHGRLIALSINLSREPYEGGTFQLRSARAEHVLRELPNVTPGDGIMFRIDRGLRHRVTDVRGVAAKTAFAGWFRNTPSFGEILGMRFDSAEATPSET
jgi:hypothetical protein